MFSNLTHKLIKFNNPEKRIDYPELVLHIHQKEKVKRFAMSKLSSCSEATPGN